MPQGQSESAALCARQVVGDTFGVTVLGWQWRRVDVWRVQTPRCGGSELGVDACSGQWNATVREATLFSWLCS